MIQYLITLWILVILIWLGYNLPRWYLIAVRSIRQRAVPYTRIFLQKWLFAEFIYCIQSKSYIPDIDSRQTQIQNMMNMLKSTNLFQLMRTQRMLKTLDFSSIFDGEIISKLNLNNDEEYILLAELTLIELNIFTPELYEVTKKKYEPLFNYLNITKYENVECDSRSQ